MLCLYFQGRENCNKIYEVDKYLLNFRSCQGLVCYTREMEQRTKEAKPALVELSCEQGKAVTKETRVLCEHWESHASKLGGIIL